MSAESWNNGTRKNRIYAEVRRSIIMGRCAPGAKIDARELARRYGTSITPVREALQQLHQEGLVTIKPHVGYQVAQVTLKELRDLMELREILELAAVERAASRITSQQIEDLERVYGGYTGDDDESYARYTAENRTFHCAIAQAAGNQELTELLGHLHDRLARYMVLRHAGETMHLSHGRIVEALRAHRAGDACRAMHDELAETHAIVLERVIQEQGDYWSVGRRKDQADGE